VTCPVCGTVAVPAARYCHHCGTALPTAAPPAAERRIVTVLFGDLSDFTAWSEESDPERVGAVTDRVLVALAGAVKTYGGHVDKLTGDGIMAVFGAPVAHEDDAERAVRAALAMQRAVRRILDDERGGGAPLGLRVGLNTGEVVALVQAALEYTVLGDTVNTAARLADAAAVGTVYAGERTVAGSRHVAAWRHLRPLRLKGKRAAVPAYELLGPLDGPGTRSGLGDEAPFVGRDTELAYLASRLAEVADRGEPSTVVLTAEAGLGKTRFAAELQRVVARYDAGAGGYGAGRPVRTLAVHCAAYGERRRLAPLADLVRVAIGRSEPGRDVAGRAQLSERLRRLSERLGRLAPAAPRLATDLLLPLLGEPGAPAVTRGDAEPVPAEAVPEAVAGLLTGLARQGPLLVVVDDLHDATPETIDALGVTLSRLAGPVLVLLLGRPELVRTAGVLTRLADAEVISLQPLRGTDATRLLSSYLDGGRLPAADADRLLATAQGNPFYLAELVTLLIEREALTSAPAGAAAGTGAAWRLAAGSLGGRLLSRDLAAVLAARIDALPAPARAVLRDAAVVGDTVPAQALAALADRRSTAGRPDPAGTGDPAVEELLHRRMLRPVRDGYCFATPLLREAAYTGIGRTDLAERHAYLARWAASAGTAGEPTDMFVADQAERAVRLADSVGLRTDSPVRTVAGLGVAALGRLARRAVAAGEPAQAAAYAQRAAELSGGALPLADRLVHARALVALGRSTEALAYAEKLVANAGDDLAVRAGALLVGGRALRQLGDGDRSYASWREALDAAGQAGLPGLQAEAIRRLGMADFFGGRLAEAGSRFTAAYQVALRAGDLRSQAWSLQNLTWVTVTRGDFAGADATLVAATRLFARLHDPMGRAWIRGTAAFVRLLAGRLAQARRLARVFLPYGERVGEHWAVGTLRAVEAFAAAELGDLDRADRQARDAYREFAASSDNWGRGLALVVRAAVARGLGSLEHAHDLLTEALGYGERTGHPLLIGMAGTIRGFVSLQRGDPAAALADADTVTAVVQTHRALPPAQVGPRVLRAAAHLAGGAPRPALELLEPVVRAPAGPSLLFPRREAVALYARALRCDGQPQAALEYARAAVDTPGEDVRSQVVALRELACCLAGYGQPGPARDAAALAVAAAYATAQRGERAASDALLVSLEVAAPAAS